MKAEEFKRGERPDGSIIGYYKIREYAYTKYEMNPLPGYGRVDLFFFGNFVRGLFVESLGDGRFLFDSHDDKADKLFGKYNKNVNLETQDIQKLNPKTWINFQNDEVVPELGKYIKKRLGL